MTLSLGIVASLRINSFLKIQQIEIPKVSFWDFILNFIIITAVLLIIIRFLKFQKGKGLIFKGLFILATSFGCLVFLEAWFSEPIPLILVALLIFWWLWKPSVLSQDTLMVLGIAGMGSVLGLALKPEILIPLLVIFSIYDFIAVYKTKHMVRMAKEMIAQRAILGFVIPPSLFGFKESLVGIQPGGKFLVLGGGDIVFPLLFSVSLIPQGILSTIIVAIFSVIGLFASFHFFVSQKVRQPIPALPPIALFSIIGYLITRFIK